MTTRLVITPPPSVNALYANGKRGRYKTKAYKDWLAVAGRDYLAQMRKLEEVRGPYTVAISLPRGIRGDIDNRAKAAIDFMVSVGLTDDDRFCQKVTVTRDPSREYLCEIIVESA
jgi:Holliday junction resolvase RusA-like endonuclease